jgi:tetratricopeptide (TPR) repeat protein
MKAQVLAYRGKMSGAAALVTELLPSARGIGELTFAVPALVTSALVERLGGNHPAAEGLVAEFAAMTKSTPFWRAAYLPEAIRTLIACEAIAKAEELLQGLQPKSNRGLHGLCSARALLAEKRGQLEEALLLFQEAVDRWRDFGHVCEEAQALLGAGRCLAALSQAGEALDILRRVRAVFVSLDAEPLLQETNSHLNRIPA